jgi:hypothetical protein
MSDELVIKFSSPESYNQLGKELPVKPAISNIPNWYKNLSTFNGTNNIKTLETSNKIGVDGAYMSTKRCTPFFDGLTLGYQYILEDDIYVDIGIDGKPIISWDGDSFCVDLRPEIDLPVPSGCHPIHYGWRQLPFYQTPPGYSVLITHPINRYDLPFFTVSAVVDADIFGLPVFNPFFLRKDFSGKIPKGTPLFQMVPFKRDNWVLEIEKDSDSTIFKVEKRRSMLAGYYKKMVWVKKTFSLKTDKNE